MAKKEKPKGWSAFLNGHKPLPVLAAIAAGLYPLLFYYTNNYRMIDSWEHLFYFTTVFLVVPIVLFWTANKLVHLKRFQKIKPYLLPFLNLFFFFSYITMALFAGYAVKLILIVLALALVLTFVVKRFFRKWLGLQLILAVIGVIWLVPVIINQLNYSETWKKQPDKIKQAVFKKKPNIYYIEPDGYLNPAQLSKGFYQFDDSTFQDFLTGKGFKSYSNFRSNYASTLTSNSATFMMKHHYYNEGTNLTEMIDAREVIVSDNAFLRVLKHNRYRTFLLLEQPYFLTNKPKMGYDYCNFSTKEINFITTGINDKPRLILPYLKKYMEKFSAGPNFFFIEIFDPGHISSNEIDSKGAKKERENYLEGIQKSNKKLTRIVNTILKKDPQALIIINSDHGGYVGLTSTSRSKVKNLDPDILHSIFNTILAIHWPKNQAPKFDVKFKTSVNLFRILTAYLSENTSYLDHLQAGLSYLIIRHGAPVGIYACLDENGKVIFKKHRPE